MITDIERVAQARHIPLSDEDKRALLNYERGELLNQVTKHPGWGHVLDIMEEQVESTEAELMNYKESDPIHLLGLQRKAVAMRDFFHNIQALIEYAIQEAENRPDILTHLGL